MARVPEISIRELPEDLVPLYRKFTVDYGDFTHQAKVLAHAPDAFRHLYGLLDSWRGHGTLGCRAVEIAVVTASRVNACDYCVSHHGLALRALGLEPAAIAGILDATPAGFDAEDLAVRDYARAVAERSRGIRDGLFDELRAHFTDQQIVELTVRIGVCILFNTFNQALQLETEESVLLASEGATHKPEGRGV